MLVFTGKAYSQNWEVGISAGGSGYMGDLNQHQFYKLTDLAVGGMVKKNFDGYWALKFSILRGTIRADDTWSKYEEQRNRDLNFHSPITEGSLQLEFNFFNFGMGYGQRNFSPYIFSGISLFGFNPKTNYQGKVYELRTYATELNEAPRDKDAYQTLGYAVPVGAGIKYRVTDNLNLSGEFGFRTASTDYLDDVSDRYPLITDDGTAWTQLRMNLSDKSIGNVNVTNQQHRVQRGDFRKKDTYMFAVLTISYVFRSKKCPL